MDELTVWTPVTLYFGEERIDAPLAVAIWRLHDTDAGEVPWSIRMDGVLMPLAISDGEQIHGLPDLVAVLADPGHMRPLTAEPQHPADPVLIAVNPGETESATMQWAVLPLVRALIVASYSLAGGEGGMIRPTASLEVVPDYGDEVHPDWLIGWNDDECWGKAGINDLVAATAQGIVFLREAQGSG